MGDNIHLGDRDGVRTPMQWSGDRNAGFSACAPEALYLPVISDPVYGYQAINVESQRQNGGSLLRWLSHILSVRRDHPQLATGTLTQLDVANPAIFAYIRGGVPGAPNPILCVANLNRQAQPAAIPLPDLVGATPVELLGDVPFPPIGHDPYPITLGPPRLPRLRARPGRDLMRVHDLPTPALVVDVERFETNLTTMAAARPGANLRPHVKAHKCTAIAAAQARVGHRSFTCATPREMVGMAAAGLGEDLLLANEVVDPARLAAMAAWQDRARMTVAVDSDDTVRAAAGAGIRDVLIDVDIGLPRCGCAPTDAGRLADVCPSGRARGARGHGLRGSPHDGRWTRPRRRPRWTAAVDLLLAAHGDVGGDIVSSGGTGTYDLHDRVTEVQAGSYALMDTQYALLGQPFSLALAVLGTVISVKPQWAVLDVGLKALGMDHGDPVG